MNDVFEQRWSVSFRIEMNSFQFVQFIMTTLLIAMWKDPTLELERQSPDHLTHEKSQK